MYDSIISSFTAEIFEISGWYKVNKDKLNILTWGRNNGCDIFTRSCEEK